MSDDDDADKACPNCAGTRFTLHPNGRSQRCDRCATYFRTDYRAGLAPTPDQIAARCAGIREAKGELPGQERPMEGGRVYLQPQTYGGIRVCTVRVGRRGVSAGELT